MTTCVNSYTPVITAQSPVYTYSRQWISIVSLICDTQRDRSRDGTSGESMTILRISPSKKRQRLGGVKYVICDVNSILVSSV